MALEYSGLGRIGVLMGGPSSEREISLKSGKSVFDALRQIGVNCVAINIVNDDRDENIELIKLQGIDCAFLALHGHFGEDGSIQEILDTLEVPYTGSNSLASKLAMDKIASKQVLEICGIPVPGYQVIDKLVYNKNWKPEAKFSFPLIVKPAGNGSSIGLSIVDRNDELGKAIELAFQYDEKVLVEEFIFGRELTVGILADKALPVIEIVPKHRFFDYAAKYQAGLTDYIIPAHLDSNIAALVQETALKVHRFLGCSGCSRVDIILSNDNRPYVLELNSIPGMTPMSLVPKAVKVLGMDFPQFCIKLIELAYEKAEIQAAS